MILSPQTFYDDLAQSYHLLFADWDRSIARQAAIFGPMLEAATGKPRPRVLDAACGIGTQTLGLAARGHSLVASDLSPSAVDRARREAVQRNLHIPFHVADLRDLSTLPGTGFDAVLAADNALPHLLTQPDLVEGLTGIHDRLAPSGVLLATVRDYDVLLSDRPSTQPPAFFGSASDAPHAFDPYRIVHQVWDWADASDRYTLHLYLTLATTARTWQVRHFAAEYRALQRADLNRALEATGFDEITWMDPAVTSFYQPIVLARRLRGR